MFLFDEKIFCSIFVFLNKQVVFSDSYSSTIFGSSSEFRNDDVFCALNTNRLYEIYKNEHDKFFIENRESIRENERKDILDSYIKILNRENSSLRHNAIKKCRLLFKKNKELSNKKLSLIVKFIDIPIHKCVYMKVIFFYKCEIKNLRWTESELAEIIFSHMFSFVCQEYKLLKAIMLTFLNEEFNHQEFAYNLKSLEMKHRKKESKLDALRFIPLSNIKKSVFNQEKEKYENFFLYTEINGESHDELYIPRNSYNFLYLFFSSFYIQVINEKQEKLLKYYTNMNALTPLLLDIDNFNKILKLCIFPNACFFLEKGNFKALNQIFDEYFNVENAFEVVIDMSKLLYYQILDNTIEYTEQQDDMRKFFADIQETSNFILQIGELQFKYSSRKKNYELYNRNYKLAKNFFLNDGRLMFYIDMIMENMFYDIPFNFQVFIKLYINTFFEKQCLNITVENLGIIHKRNKYGVKFVNRLFKQIGHNNDSESLGKFKLNTFINKNKIEDGVPSTNVLICDNSKKSFKISQFKNNKNIPKNIFLFGKFNNIEINTNKIIDIYIKDEFLSMVMYKQEKDWFDQQNFYSYSAANYEQCINSCSEKNIDINISIKNYFFTLYFNNIFILQSNEFDASFIYNSSQSDVCNISVYHCIVEFAEHTISKSCNITLQKTSITFKKKIFKYQCIDSIKPTLNILDSEILNDPELSIHSATLCMKDNFGNVKIKYDHNSFIEIYRHSGVILLNDYIICEFMNRESYFKYSPYFSSFDNFHVKYLNTFSGIRFGQRLHINYGTRSYRFVKCVFNEDCKIYLKKTKDELFIDIFKMLGYANTYHLKLVDLEIFHGEIRHSNFMPL